MLIAQTAVVDETAWSVLPGRTCLELVMDDLRSDRPLTSFHWGTYEVETCDGRVIALHPFSEDPDPSPIGTGIVDVLDGPTRIHQPMVRKGWLESGPGSSDKRGLEPFVAVSWEEAERIVAAELTRVKSRFGNQAIYAGSYGWASAGRFHHAQSQIHRFLNCIGGYTRSKNTYSFAAGEVIVPHVLGGFREFVYPGTSWRAVVANTRLVVAFGGVPLKNGQIAQGGVGRHRQRDAMREAIKAGVEFISISPLRSDIVDGAAAEWLAARPSTDTAILLGLAHTLIAEDLHDRDFLQRYTVGFDRFAAYLDGSADGVAKTADWAAAISGLDADRLRHLARQMADVRTMLSVSWSLTRQDHGEQPFWAAITLAAMLGQIGLPGGGIGFGYSAVNSVGNDYTVGPWLALPQGENPVSDYIPVARVSDMLLHPGTEFDYNGDRCTYPEIKIVYWAGGNPFHHHQDLGRMVRAWSRPDTVIAHEWCWNALAKHADIVLPCTTPLEREDIALTPRDGFIVYMEKAAEPAGQARSDYEILSGIAQRMGVGEMFSEGRNEPEWIRYLYDRSRQRAAEVDIDMPTLAELRASRWIEIDPPEEPDVLFRDFRANPDAHPLNTPSGKIEIWSETIAGFGYSDCPPHAAWLEPAEWLGNAGKYPLHLISNQPKDKLHGQLDHGAVSRAGKVAGRQPVTIHRQDAAVRGIAEGQVVRVFNDRGTCYCGVRLSDAIRPGVIQIATGAWFDVDTSVEPMTCKHGNPNVLTMDKGGSRLAQGPIAHSCLVDIARADNPPPVSAFEPPRIVRKDAL